VAATMSGSEGSTSAHPGGNSLASFKRAVLLSRLEIGARQRVRSLVCDALSTPPVERSDAEVERVFLYVAQQQLGRLEGCSNELLRAICGRLTLVRLQPFHKLFSSGDPGDACYIVVDGTLEEVQDKDGPGKETTARSVSTGECFGDIEGLTGVRRSLGIRCAADECLLARLSCADFVELQEAEREREIEVARSFLTSLHQLRRMPHDAMQQLAAAAERVHFDRHAVVGAQGEQPDYIIIPTTEGDATLSVRQPAGNAARRPEEFAVATLAMKGEFIGLGLIFDDSYESYRYPCSIVLRVPIEALRVHHEHAKRCFRSRAVVRALREAHHTRHSLTLDQIRRMAGCNGAKAGISNLTEAANSAPLSAAENSIGTSSPGSVLQREPPPGEILSSN
jgi:CRP-like cAMP-binding protein